MHKFSSGSRIWSRGGPRNFFRDFANVEKRSRASKGSRIILAVRWALEALAFLIIKYAFSHLTSAICVFFMRKSRVLLVNLV